jgi:uncharacterized protein (UPF0548 family)
MSAELAALSYQEHAATRGELPAGYHRVERVAVLGRGPELFARARAATFAWGIQTGSGIRVRVVDEARGRPLRAGDTVVMRVPLWPRDVPCRVVYVIDETRDIQRLGFAYGTLPGHPESGEEAFIVDQTDDGSVWLTIRAFSRPASWQWWVVYPFLRIAQAIITRRYFRALTGPLD